MKLITTQLVVFLFALVFSVNYSVSQCVSTIAYGGGAAPTASGTTQLSAVIYAGEYSPITGVAAATSYLSESSTGSDYITITMGATVIAHGPSPLTWVSTVAGTYNQHIYTDAACGTQNNARISSVTHITPMIFNTAAVVQSNFSSTPLGTVNQEIIGINVNTSGNVPALDLTQLVFNTTGSTNPLTDIANINIYYTGNSSIFSNATLYATAAPAAVGTPITINTAQTLTTGDNYFWIAYDIAATATIGNFVDAQGTSVTLNDGNGAQTPVPTTVAGDRLIVATPPSPGGVTGLTVWLKANSSVFSDAGTTSAVEGAGVQLWNELSGFGALTNLSQTTAVRRPIYRTASYNYNPAVSTENLITPHVMLSPNITDTDLSASGDLTFYSLYTQSAGAVCHLWNGQSQSKYGFQNNIAFCQGDVLSGSVVVIGDATIPAVKTVEQTNASGVVRGYNNNLFTGTTTNNGLSSGNFISPYSLGALPNSTSPGTAKISEIIYFDGVHSLNDRTKVSTYLALKYGITLNNTGGGVAGDYIATDNTVIWDASVSPAYHNNVIGIGKDIAEELEQKQSHTLDDSRRLYLNTLSTTNETNAGSFSSDVSYVVMGDDQNQMCATVASLGEMPAGCGLYSRLEREWKVTKTNFGQTFNTDFTIAACGAPGSVDVSHLRLLVDDDGDFSNGGTTCYFNGDGTGIVISYTNPKITISNISNTHISNNSTRFFTIGSINSATPLPVEFTSFQATCDDDFIVLEWETASENNNDYFTIEKSRDGVSFQTVAKIDASGNTSSSSRYKWNDNNRFPRLTYYRLLQTDIDGTTKILSTRTVDCGIPLLMAYPNPFNSQLNVESDCDGVISLRDVTGKIVFQENYIAGKTIFNVQHLAAGVFFVELKNENGSTKEMKLVKY